ncbi:hypothetical protein RhiLY_07507 [Ceratobasidium sp. AG-Ba]|nr:hypothetical protein RhiLY_07507 [Ceratobasidium sp. AG-Ba]
MLPLDFSINDSTNLYEKYDQEAVYEYQLVALSNRPSWTAREGPGANQTVVYRYPFDDMPVIRSHVHPFFAILAAGESLVKHKYDWSTHGSKELRTSLPLCAALYRFWTSEDIVGVGSSNDVRAAIL